MADFEKLKSESRRKPMDGNHLSLYPLTPTRKILVTFEEGLTIDPHYFKLHFEQFTCVGAVEDIIDDSLPNRVLVTFKDSKSECIQPLPPRKLYYYFKRCPCCNQ